jgi:putative ABC transport system ATP-binding protein
VSALPSAHPALQADGLEVRRGDHLALRRLDLTIPAGTMLAVTGPSGSGKSSLLGALAGVYPASAGAVRIAGTDVVDRDSAARLGALYLPQAGSLVSTLSAEENVVVTLHAHGVDPTDAVGRAREALATVGLEDEHGHLAEELSGGQQQRAAIAVMLALRARVLLLDEPTSELDAVNRQRILATLRAQAMTGAAVVIGTHDPEAAAPADAELVLDEGHASWARPLPGTRASS